jgi:hypothetical protein
MQYASFQLNQALGGAAGPGAIGGTGLGGAVANVGSTTSVIDCYFSLNQAQGGTGATGGIGQGGGLSSTNLAGFHAASLTVNASVLSGNNAIGGNGSGSGGNGQGGGLFVDAGTTATVRMSLITGNGAIGGTAGAGGTPGQGVGGGVYTLGTFDLDSFSLVFANHATTSNNNVFGTITPI